MLRRKLRNPDFDTPWKEALEYFLEACLAFFFPAIHKDIDWRKGYESLDKELHRVLPEADIGRRLADKLFKVWRKDGEEAWLLIHIEVQGERETEFPRRMFVYNYRIFDRYNRPVVSLAVLTDNRADWRPDEFGYGDWGFRTQIRYGVAKLLDHAGAEERLEAEANPFAAVVLAHLRALATREDPLARQQGKTGLVKGLYHRGWSAEDVRQLFRIIDWMMTLPVELEQQFWQEMAQFEEERHMPYVTSVERIAEQRGREEGLEKGFEKGLLAGIASSLKAKFGPAGKRLMPRIRKLHDIERLRTILDAIPESESLDEIQQSLR